MREALINALVITGVVVLWRAALDFFRFRAQEKRRALEDSKSTDVMDDVQGGSAHE